MLIACFQPGTRPTKIAIHVGHLIKGYCQNGFAATRRGIARIDAWADEDSSPGGGADLAQPSLTKPKLADTKCFALFTANGHVLDFDKLLRVTETDDATFSANGESMLVVKTHDEGVMMGNAGSSTVKLSSGFGLGYKASLNAVEETGFGHIQVLTIFDAWSEKKAGFPFIYRRSLFGPEGGVVSSFWGYAKPAKLAEP